MPRSIWTGAISFGLVNVPVKLYTAVRKQDVSFNQLHEKDGGRIHYKRVCSKDGEEVPYEEIAKGYEISKGHYVMIEPEELEALDPESTHTIDILDFVELAEIDPLYFDTNYFIVPDGKGDRAYRLLLEAMEDSGRVGIAKVVMRTKQHLVAVRPVEGALVMTILNYADEVMERDELEGIPSARMKIDDRELKIAQQLIDSLATEWDPTRYADEHRDKVLDLVEQKAKGKEIVSQPSEEKRAPVVDLMAALEASLAATKKGGSAKATVDVRTDDERDADEAKSARGKAAKKAAKKPTKATKKATKKRSAKKPAARKAS